MIDIRIDGVGSRLVPYADGLAQQYDLHRAVSEGSAPDTVLLLEHEAVYTAGKRTEAHERPVGRIPVVDVDRGGKITWHGPGQLVGYPILRLPQPRDVVAYVRSLEGMLIDVVREFGVDGVRIGGRSGVWVRTGFRDAKLAAVGIRVAADTTMHGFALNCSNDLAPFSAIVPCGISDADVTTLSQLLGRRIDPVDVVEHVAARVDMLQGATA
ncbi:lipoyl(octanoyl) transferase LipB [Salinibacterium sp. ZJ450]|uniref:lipoyl(octanoyl) transferase LipB n=1 Tax=Salinibacterium sp. ZJ450 TaxID=2708338 RepID=UPI00141FF098|nr:lipoyl(octanoyl) transferase LipB [Salinibacterium sp. ZJ450]